VAVLVFPAYPLAFKGAWGPESQVSVFPNRGGRNVAPGLPTLRACDGYAIIGGALNTISPYAI
jgi:hypothetical protein